MSQLDWSFVKETLADALDLEPARREAFVRSRCDGQPQLRDAVERLLRGHDSATGFLDGTLGNDSADRDPAPERIGPYRVREALGEGGFGVVHRATQMHPFEREVAIKILKGSNRAAAIVERFRVERDALARMDHEDICRVLDAGLTDDGRPFVVMDLVRGRPISEFCREGRVNLAGRVALLRRAALAVHHAHQRAVIHCDVKPSNILVAQDDEGLRLRLIDFGIAQALDAAVADGSRSGFAGTPRYMSPERRKVVGLADVRSDVYSLGAVLDELLAEAVNAGLARDARLLRDVRAIAARAIAAEPTDRYESAAALAADLGAALDDRPIQAIPERTGRTVARLFRRHRLASTLAATALLAIMGGAVAALHGRTQAIAARDEATREARRAELVRDFLLDDMLGSLNPDVAQGKDITVVELLSRVDERMRTSLTDDPLLLADVAGTLARAYAHVGRDPEAIAAYKLAIATRESAFGESTGREPTIDDRARVLEWEIDLATAMLGTTEHHSEGLARRSWNAANTVKYLGPWHPLSLRARLAHTPFPLDVAERTRELEEILAHARAMGAEGEELVETTSRNLAPLYTAVGRHDEAINLTECAVASAERRVGTHHGDAIVTRRAFAEALFRAGELDRANEHFDIIIERCRSMLAPDHPALTGMLTQLAARKISVGHPDDAIAMMREVEATLRARQGEGEGEGSVQHTTALLTLGQAYVAKGLFEDADRTLTPIIARLEGHWGVRNLQTARGVLALAQAKLGRGDLDAALELATNITHRIGYNGEEALEAVELRCELLTRLGRSDEAERLAGEALKALPATASDAIRQRLTDRAGPSVAR
jgi:tetratricopeptide (TPR) repeat protein